MIGLLDHFTTNIVTQIYNFKKSSENYFVFYNLETRCFPAEFCGETF